MKARHHLALAGDVDLPRTARFVHRDPDGQVRPDGAGLRAVVRAGGGLAGLRLVPARGGVAATLELQPGADEALALRAARQLAGLPPHAAQPDARAEFLAIAERDPAMEPVLAATRGFRLPQDPDPAGCVVRAIVAQQVTVAFAATLARRVRERWGERVRLMGEEWLLPPRAEVMAGVEPDALRPLQLSQRKAEFVRDLSAEIADGRLDLHAHAALPAEAAMASLVARRGIGPTTAGWLLMFGAGHPDAWPPADVGLWRALDRIHGRHDGRAVERWSKSYEGVRTHLAVHLWEAQRAGALPDPPPRRRVAVRARSRRS